MRQSAEEAMMMLYHRCISRLQFHKNRQAAQTFILAATAIILTVVLVACPATVRAAGDLGISRDLESALLSENWNQVISIISGSSPGQAAIMRFLRGHACLALNRNNESFCLFIGATSDDQERWRQWSQDFAKSHPSHPVAVYFKGDGLARLQMWSEALEAFTRGLDTNPRPEARGLLLNARGVVLAGQKKWGAARQDFKDASDTFQLFADAYASRGTLNLHQKEGAQKGVEYLSLAISHSPTFALAFHNRGLLQLALKREQESQDDLAKAEKYGGCGTALWLENRVRIAAFLRSMDKSELFALTQAGKPGMTMQASYGKTENLWNNYHNNRNQWNYNRFHENLSMLSPDQQRNFYNNIMVKDMKGDKSFQHQYQTNLNEVGKTNQYNGLAMQTSLAIRGLAPLVGTASGSLAGPGTAATLGIAANIAGSLTADRVDKWTDKNYRGYQTLTDLNVKYLQPSGNVSGVDLSWAGAYLDEGKWPFFVCYGLVYPVEPVGPKH
jgi:hypothetical protein